MHRFDSLHNIYQQTVIALSCIDHVITVYVTSRFCLKTFYRKKAIFSTQSLFYLSIKNKILVELEYNFKRPFKLIIHNNYLSTTILSLLPSLYITKFPPPPLDTISYKPIGDPSHNIQYNTIWVLLNILTKFIKPLLHFINEIGTGDYYLVNI